MFLRTKAGSVVTHKITMRSGSLCVLSGRAEVRYKRSIPKDFGVDGEQYFMIMTQKSPDASILKELMEITTPTDKSVSGTYATEHVDSSQQHQQSVESCSSLDTSKEHGSKSEHGDPKGSPQLSGLKTPPTVKRIGALVFDNEKPLFKDGPDMEASESLLLSETIFAAVKRMDDSAVTTELIRSHCPVNGTLEEKQRRLQNKLCMSLGEMSMSAANMNTSVNFLRQASPEMDNSATVQLHGDLEMLNDTFTNSQKCIEDTLKLVVDNIVEMKSEISNVKQSSQPAADMQCFTDDHNRAVAEMKLSIQSLSSEVKQCSLRINELVKKLGEV